MAPLEGWRGGGGGGQVDQQAEIYTKLTCVLSAKQMLSLKLVSGTGKKLKFTGL